MKNSVKHRLALLIEKASHILGNKGEKLYNTLQEIMYGKPFRHLIDGLQLRARQRTLEKLHPIIYNKLSNNGTTE